MVTCSAGAILAGWRSGGCSSQFQTSGPPIAHAGWLASTPPHPPPSQVPLLAPLTAQQRLALCEALTTRKVEAGAAVITKGEAGDTFYVIEEGSCVVVGDEGQVGRGLSCC